MNIRKAVSILGGLALSAFAAFGQITPSTTTLSAAVTANAKSVVLASVSAVTIPGVPNGTTLGGPVSPYSYEYLYVDRELMTIRSVNGTTVYVQRGVNGTKATAHNSGAVVTVTRPANFTTVDLAGSCTVTGALVLPQINPATGNAFNCLITSGSTTGVWGAYSAAVDVPVVGPQITAAATIAPSAPVFHLTGATPVATITVPAGFTAGSITIIPDSAFTTVATGNIAIASTAVVGKAMIMTFDNVAGKWYPSY